MSRLIYFAVTALLGLSLVLPAVPRQEKRSPPARQKILRAGIIGLDTSHVVAFTQLLHRPDGPPELSGVKVVAAYPGGSPDIPDSKNRLEKFTKILREKFQVEIVASVEELVGKVDVVLLESLDGRTHLKQILPVFKAAKPVFIDKPVAGSLADALRLFALAKEYKTPCFSSSALRFSPGIRGMRDDPKVGAVLGCDVHGPCSLEPHHPDLFWYGVHGVEALFTIMGGGCERVTRVHTKDHDLAAGTWKDGRVGSYRGIRKGSDPFGGTVFGAKGVAPLGQFAGYEPLVQEIVRFFKTGRPPVTAEETIEIFAFMEAADESKRRGGRPVRLAEVLAKAKREIVDN